MYEIVTDTLEKRVMDIARILDHYDIPTQTAKTIEELAELQEVIVEYIITDHDVSNELAEETADVLIMLSQLMLTLVPKDKVAEMIEYKIDRQLRRISEGEKDVCNNTDRMETHNKHAQEP